LRRTPAYSHRGYIRIFEKSATYVLEVLGGLCPALDRVGQNLAQNVLKTDICSKNSKKIQKNSKSLQRNALSSRGYYYLSASSTTSKSPYSESLSSS
jgi:hypothetical protein